MDVIPLVASPAQAGHQPVKPGLGLAGGAGSAPAAEVAAGEGFASLVALALDQLAGDASTTSASSSDGASDVDVALDEGDEASPAEAAVDAATLSLLIALATPAAAPVPTPEPEVVEEGGTALAAVAGDIGATSMTAADAPAMRIAAAVAGTPAFEDALAAATTPPAAGADGPVAPTPALASTADTIADAAAPTTVAGATTQTPGSAAAVPSPQPAAAPAPVAAPGAAAAPGPRTGQRAPVHPLRQALASAMAAAAPADQAGPVAATDSPRPSTIAASAPAAAPAAGAAGHEGRAAAVPRVDAAAVTPVAAFGAASDTGPAGDGSSTGERDGFAAAASSPALRGAESRLDASAAFAAVGAAATDAATIAPTTPPAGFGAAGDTMLRAIDLPAAARFEQTLSSVDPDVRNLQAMVRTVRLFSAADGAHEARLTLDPEHLGPVALTVRVEQGSVSAHFRADTPAAQRWIETHQQELRAGLRDQGLEVKELVVTTDPDGRRDRRQDAPPPRPARNRRPQDTDAPRFEVLV